MVYSHPSRVRGLKLAFGLLFALPNVSHPSRVRGLKHAIASQASNRFFAPITGAWIETVVRVLDSVVIVRTHHGCVD